MNNYKIIFNYFKTKYNTTDSFDIILTKLLTAYEKGSSCIDVLEDEKKILTSLEVIGFDKPLIIENDLLYFQKYYFLEKSIIEKIKTLIKLNKFKMITGGPGTGKTTNVSKELANKLIENKEFRISLAAPTGKASIRMKESIENTLFAKNYGIYAYLENKVSDIKRDEIIKTISSLQPITIHNLIGALPGRTDYVYKSKKLEKHIIVIDEASMIDIDLMEKLLSSLDLNILNTIYLIGDKNQLTSVDVGSVFKDLSESITDDLIHKNLKVNYRAKDQEGIINLIKDIEDENISNIKLKNYTNVKFETFFKNIVESSFVSLLVKNYLDAKTVEEVLEKVRKLMILTAYRVGVMGSININKEILKTYKNLRFIPYILTKNDYNRKLFNGDIGILDKTTNLVYFDNKVAVEFIYLTNIEPAFAITIHKSQGSEYDDVLLILKDDDVESSFITKELIYTGVSRTKEMLTILTGDETFIKGITKKADRASGIIDVRWDK